MKAHLILAMLLVVAVVTAAEAHAAGDSDNKDAKNAPNFEPKITKDQANQKIETIEFKCKLK
jgi:hypothetical protein